MQTSPMTTSFQENIPAGETLELSYHMSAHPSEVKFAATENVEIRTNSVSDPGDIIYLKKEFLRRKYTFSWWSNPKNSPLLTFSWQTSLKNPLLFMGNVERFFFVNRSKRKATVGMLFTE